MNILNYETQIYPYCRSHLTVELFGHNEATNHNSMKVSKVVESMNKKMLLYNFGDYCNVPSLPDYSPELRYKALNIVKFDILTKI